MAGNETMMSQNKPTLWKETRAGMTVSEVAALFPSASRPGDPGVLHNGSTEDLELQAVNLGAASATARFYFLNGGLSQVTLHVEGLQENATTANLTTAKEIAQSLDVKYGAGRRDKSSAAMHLQCDWRIGDVNIALFYMDIGGAGPILNIVYQTRFAGTQDNL